MGEEQRGSELFGGGFEAGGHVYVGGEVGCVDFVSGALGGEGVKKEKWVWVVLDCTYLYFVLKHNFEVLVFIRL